MSKQPKRSTNDASAELTQLLCVQDSIQQQAREVGDLNRHIAAAQGDIDRLQATRPDVAAMRQQRSYVASCVATADMQEGHLLQLEQDIAKAEFSSTGIEAQIAEKLGLIEGFTQRRSAAQARADALRKSCAQALLALLMEEANEAGAEYVQAAQQLEQAFARLVGLTGILGGISGEARIRQMGAICVPSFSLPVVEQAQKPYAPYQLIDYRNLAKGPKTGWIAEQLSRLRSMGVQID